MDQNSQLKIKTMINGVVIVLLVSKEHGGTRTVMMPISMASISLESTPPLLMALNGMAGRHITTHSNSLR